VRVDAAAAAVATERAAAVAVSDREGGALQALKSVDVSKLN
jgi:hypothetical protein